MRFITFILVLFAFVGVEAKEIVVKPPANIVSIVEKEKYNDFPRAIDIYSIIMNESSFRPKAYNPEISKKRKKRTPPSVGLMQVQGGSFDTKTNIKQGVKKLRENYIRYCNKDVKCAVMSYNIGPTNYRKRIALGSGKEYYLKYLKHKKQYAKLGYN